MNWPTSQDYNEAVQDPSMSFSDPGLQGGEVVVNALGLPVPRSGNFADVYQFTGADGKVWALKCFTRKVAGLRERYAKIDEHLAKARLPFTVGFKFLQQGVKIRGEWYPLLKMEWVEGFTLNDFVARNLGKPHHLHALMQMWAKLAARVRDANMAHADLQHGNVLLVPGATPQKLGLKLIDYDGMWVPALAEFHSGEVGHPNFQHPLRLKEKLYNGDVDRFPHLVIAAGLRAALVGGQATWDKFDNGDNLLFKEADFRDPANAPVFKALWELNDPVLRVLVGHIALSTRQPLRKTPWLDDVLFQEGGPKLTADEEQRVVEMLGVTAAAPTAARATAPAAVEQEFNVFQFLDEDEGPKSAVTTTSGRRPIPKRRPAKKSNAPLFIGGGVAAALLLIVGIVAAMTLGPKKNSTTELVKGGPDSGQGTTGQTTTGKPPVIEGGGGDPNLPDDPGVGQPPVGAAGAPAAVAAVGSVRDYLFIRTGDPALYQTVNGTARKARVVGRAASPIRSLATGRDGARAVTGGEDGEVRVWTFPGPRAALGRRITGYDAIGLFQDRFGIDYYDRGVVFRDNNTGQEEVAPVGKPGPAVAARFAGSLAKNDKLARDLGPPVSDEVKLFGGAVVVQAFEGGAMTYNPAVNKMWWSWHARRRPAADDGPGSPPAATKRADYVWVDDELPPGARPALNYAGAAAWDFVGADDGPVHTGQKAVRIVAAGARQNVFEEANPGMRVGAGDILFAYVYLDPKSPPEEIMIQWAGHGWQRGGFRRAYWGANKIQLSRDGTPELKPMGPLPETGKWVRLEVKIDDLDIQPGVTVSSLALTQFGGTAYWDTIGVNTATPQAGGSDAPATTGPLPKVHTAAVVACAVSPDGSRAVTIGRDRQLCEWDLYTAKLIHKFEVPEARAVAYTPDGKSALIGTEAESAGVWNLATKTRTKELEGHTVPVRAVCVSPQGDRAWTGAVNGKVQAWALPEFKQLGWLPAVGGPVVAMAASRGDTQVLAVAGADGTVHYFDPKTGAEAGTHPDKAPIRALAFLPGGLRLAAAREPDPIVIGVPPPKGSDPSPPPPAGPAILKLVQEAEGPAVSPQRIGYRADGKYLWLASQNSITVADGATGREVKTWPIEGNVFHAAFGPGTELYVALAGGRFQAWDWEKGERLHDYDPAEQRAPRPLNFWALPAPNRLLVTTNSPAVLVWDTAKWKEAERLTPYATEIVGQTAPYPGGGRFAALVVGQGGRNVVVWDAVQRREALRMEGGDLRGLIHLDVSPGGRWVVGLSLDGGGRVLVWDGKTGKLAQTVPGVKTSSFGGGFSPGGDHYFYGEQTARRLDINLTDGKLTDESRGVPPPFVTAAAPTANLVATADLDRKVRIWRFEVDTKPADPLPDSGSPPPPPSMPIAKEGFIKDSAELSDVVVAAAVSSDGKKVFVATQKGMVHVLDAATADETAKLEAIKGRPLQLVLSPKYVSPVNGAAIPDRVHILDDARHLHTWEADKGTKSRDVNLEKASLPAISAGSRLVVAPGESHVMVFDPERSEAYSWVPGRWSTAAVPTALQRPPFNKETRTVAFSTDGSVGAAYAARKLLVWKTRGGIVRTIDTTLSAGWVAVAADAGVVAVGDGGRLLAWKYETGGEVLNVRDPHGFVRGYFAAATGTWLVTVGADRWFRVWDLRTGKEATKWRMEQAPAGVSVSADGRTAVVWYEEGSKVGLWMLPDPKGKKP